MKNIKNYLLTFILGGIIFSGLTVFAEYVITADKIEYSANTSVKDKIDDLYTKVKPAYTGSLEVTPSANTQILYTKNKLLNSNISINPIPSTYKNLITTTTATQQDILSGKTAYDNNGNLITGSVSADCIKGSFVWNDSYSTNGYKVASFNPAFFAITSYNIKNSSRYLWYYNKSTDSSNFYSITFGSNAPQSVSLSSSTSFVVNNGLTLKWGTNTWTGQTVNYVICK